MLSSADCLRPLTSACPSAVHRLASVSAIRRPFSSVVCLAKPPRAADFRGLSKEQIEEEVAAAKRALFDLRIKQRTRQEIKTHEFGIYKKKVAQLMTVAREKDIAEAASSGTGPSLRDRRRQEKKDNVKLGFGQF